MIDSHCHLDHEPLYADILEVLKRSKESGVKKILDVGSGSGNLALKLLNSGYDVDCVIPSEYLAKAVKEKLNDHGEIFISKFEDMTYEKNYDLILFSESFQYVNIEKSLNKIKQILCQDGYLLICDLIIIV